MASWDFTTNVTWLEGEKLNLGCHGMPDIAVTPPPQFGGEEGYWTPEDLLVGSVDSCMLLTALFFVGKYKINLKAYKSHATGNMEKTAEGLRFTGITVHVEGTVSEEAEIESFKKALEMAEKFCPVSAAVSCPVHLDVSATVG